MNRLFIRLYLDEDVSNIVARMLHARGFEATTTHEANRNGATDGEQLAFAVEQGLTLLTHNRVDFEALDREAREQQRAHAGIIIAIRRPPALIVRR